MFVYILKREIGYIRSLLNCVPCLLKTCSRANMTCVRKCSGANVPCVLTCQRPLCANVLTCQCAMRAHVITCQHALSPLPNMLALPRDQLPTCLASSVISLDIIFSVSLLLLLKLYTLLVRFENLINVFPQ